MSKTTNKFSPEVRERAVRMVDEHRADYGSEWAAMTSIAGKIGCTAETLRRWCREEASRRAGPAAQSLGDKDRLKALEREVKELRRANEILRKASAYFCAGGARPPRQMVMSFIDMHGKEQGIEPICRELAVAPSSYHEHSARLADPAKRPARAKRDDEIKDHIQRVHDDSSGLYGTRKVWHQMRREGIKVAKCTVERLMRAMGLAGVRRGKTTITTVSNPKAACPLDKVNRQFRVTRPNALWVVDFTYVHTWAGFVYVAFVIDAYARRIVGWKVSTAPTANFVLDALEQAIHARKPGPADGLIHHSDRGVQYLAMNYTQRLAEAKLVPSVGSVGDSYDNALAETINGLYKAEVIWRQRSWPGVSAVEMATLRWVDWFNNHRLFGPIGYIPPAEAEANYYAALENLDMVA
ncbi:IS3 family transposase [Sphingomonas sp. 10B4]|uniref:IS3 family transposase n=1 Tax=Sphingomonas sp. 10B4 TaxID=3048575 RepID=UPI002AB595C7|nr:IS3 family transposase [Sphingomonas sp. 10B4]MDY7523063.1 IS3 family transposase [Sphingomonas sp. 10B4]MDY7523681.1 IS3 family transposase [Sphingomonas sp. 10B4]MDY7523705.1 IS3 family transposase [Sphingomonas sp. 10B4]MDY7526187.1 IS3 family transposase [Sphingomonas sp. 10B4]MDY7526194.1 IS3 family transposase [Sphingomonas sp. 10B4]